MVSEVSDLTELMNPYLEMGISLKQHKVILLPPMSLRTEVTYSIIQTFFIY